MTATRFSKQRDAILNVLVESHDHPTAETLHERLRARMPSISLGTVYRNLAFLVDAGKVARVKAEGEVSRFDARTERHYHLQCRACGAMVDLDMEVDPSLDGKAESRSGGRVFGHELRFYGLCRACAAKE
jgi:Fe2+ or Zn2+ uptake regulation protein